MTATLVPDIEKLVTLHLRGVLTTRVEIATPKNRSTPWVRVTQLDGRSRDIADHLVAYTCQFDCYAGDVDRQQQIGQANTLGREVRAELHGLPGTHDDGTVTGVNVYNHIRIPDTDFEPARQRVILTATVWAHS
jgi:hypothetical protein